MKYPDEADVKTCAMKVFVWTWVSIDLKEGRSLPGGGVGSPIVWAILAKECPIYYRESR